MLGMNKRDQFSGIGRSRTRQHYGLDGLYEKLLKELASIIINPFCEVYNKSTEAEMHFEDEK